MIKHITLTLCALALTAHAASPSQQAFVQQLIKSEPKVKDATWMTTRNLYVGVLDDGTRRDGYAQYICEEAKSHGATMVKVVDIAKVKRTGKFEELGKAFCR